MKPIKILVCLPLILFLTTCDRESESIEGAGTGGEAVLTATTNSSPSFADQADAGEELYNTSCSTCHGQNLEGTPVGPGLYSLLSIFTITLAQICRPVTMKA